MFDSDSVIVNDDVFFYVLKTIILFILKPSSLLIHIILTMLNLTILLAYNIFQSTTKCFWY